MHAHPLSLHLPSPVKLQCTLQLSGVDRYTNPVSSLVKICTLWFSARRTGSRSRARRTRTTRCCRRGRPASAWTGSAAWSSTQPPPTLTHPAYQSTVSTVTYMQSYWIYNIFVLDKSLNSMKHTCNFSNILYCCTDKEENKIFLICMEIQMGAVAKSYIRKGLLQ